MASAALNKIIEDNAPHRPYCANVKNAARVRALKDALEEPYLQLNSPTHQSMLVVDIDRSQAATVWMDANLPPPTYVATNGENGHAQIGYALASPVCRTEAARLVPLRFLAAVEYAYTLKAGGDFAFSGPLAKNPLHPHWRVWEPANAPTYELNYLAEFVELPKRLPSRQAGVGRNCDMFENLRSWAYSAVRAFWRTHGEAQWIEAVLRQAEMYNTFDTPLAFSELRSIARSISRFVWRNFSQSEFHQIQSERGHLGGIASGEVRRAAAAGQRTLAKKLYEEGLSKRAIATQLNVGRATIGRWLID
jgi:hypothetical protein